MCYRLFPIRESGLNWHAQELQLHEIKKIQKNKKAMKRILTSYKMMLDFYGMELENEDDGTIVRADNWRDRFRQLNRSFHNYLRITRILKCLGEFGYEHLKKNFVKFILHEGMVEGTLSNVIDSCVKYWIGVLKDDEEREEIFDYYEKLLQDENLQTKRRNRSPSPPSSYWSDKIEDSKSDKKSLSKNGKDKKADNVKDKKDEVDGDNKNEISDDGEDGTLYYAMSLIDEDLPKGKSRKDHEMSDSGPENDDHPEESQEMAHLKEEAKTSKNDELEGGSECDDSVPGKMTTGKINSVNETEEEGPKEIVEQNSGDKTESDGKSSTINGEIKEIEEIDPVGSENENKGNDKKDVVGNSEDERTDPNKEKHFEKSALKTSDENVDLLQSNHEKMETTDTENGTHSDSELAAKGNKINLEEKSIESTESNSNKISSEVENKEEELMETETGN
ncbi:opioid growth factor receptor-like protein 1 isoform X1 [Ruditapes philippinarum]|uniref:opioid growth factor receptor-like protein 1 isoform X1 n=1 Tax=Ruditapes philippinarum TaxID=129788 RepID=UPI00295BA4D3|nr:opioid growth factor receptor-like protein 1 isoform X1 [Ruditapes philippinarum]